MPSTLREERLYVGGQSLGGRGGVRAPPHNRDGATINDCPPITPLFKGQRTILEKLDSYFSPRAGGTSCRREFLLYGLGGSGKSQIALKFAEMSEQRFKYVLWLDATNTSTIEKTYKDIVAAICGTNAAQMSLDAARAALSSLDEDWLLIIDGADDAGAMTALWPLGRGGNILCTSRNPLLNVFATDAVCAVTEMDDDEAVQLLLDTARLMPALSAVTALAKGIVNKLGNLALAIDQAWAFIAWGHGRIYDFLDTFDRRRASLLDVVAYNFASLYEQTVYATWELSHSAIERQAAGELEHDLAVQVARNAMQLLNMLAYFHFENVTEDIFKRAAENSKRGWLYPRDVDPNSELAGDDDLPTDLLPLDGDRHWDPQPFRKCVGLLTSLSLLLLDQLSGTISMHRLAHQWAFDRLSMDIRLAALRTTAATLAGSTPVHSTVEDYAVLRQLLPHIVAMFQKAAIGNLNPLQNADQMKRVAHVHFSNGQYAQASRIQQRALDTSKKLLGSDHEVTLKCMRKLAWSFSQLGRVAAAEALLQQGFKISKTVLGPEHPETQACMGSLAMTIRKQSRAADAEALHQQEYEISKRVLGPEHPDTLVSMGNLALAIRKQGLAAEAKALHQQVFEMKKRVLGPEHPSTLSSMHNLASIMNKAVKPRKALDLMLQCYELRREKLGENHPLTKRSLSHINRWTKPEVRKSRMSKWLRILHLQ